MIKAIHQSARNMHAKIKNIEIVANNLANISTTGYKRELPFSELVTRFQDNRYKQISDFTQGAYNTTGNPFDLAIEGKGFFAVQTDKGVELTRNGKFSISKEGFLQTQTGDKVLSEGGVINFSDLALDKNNDVKITNQGEILVAGKSKGRLKIVSVDDQQKMERTRNSAFITEKAELERPDEKTFSVLQGFLEESNINPVLEMQSMITLSKDFEAAQKLISNYDQQLSRVNEIGRVI